MNKTPSILVDTGFEVDQNGLLTELDIPNVVTTLAPPRKIVFSGTTLSYLPSTAAALQELNCPNAETIPEECCNGFTSLTSVNIPKLAAYSCTATSTKKVSGAFNGCTGLTSISLPVITSITSTSYSSATNAGLFCNCTNLVSINLPALTTLTTSSSGAGAGAFKGCVSLNTVTLPLLSTISSSGSGSGCGVFYGCTGLTSVNLPALSICSGDTVSTRATFGGCTGLTSVQLGSEGHPVTSLGAYMFNGCTQSGLTITVYTADGNAISGSPWGATNATVIWEEA